MDKPQFTVVVPVYNGQDTIVPLFAEMEAVFTGMNETFTVVFVCDGARDSSWEIIESLHKQHPSIVKGVRLTRNFGQHNAIICGFEFAEGNYIITMDEDLQHNPRDIPSLFEEMKSRGLDVIYGKARKSKHNSFRNITSGIIRIIAAWAIPGLHRDYSAYRVLRSNIAYNVIEMRNSYTFLDGYLAWITEKVGSKEVDHRKRYSGESSYSIARLLAHAINIFVTFSNMPIKMLTAMSLLSFATSSMYAAIIFIRKILYNDLVPGYAALAIMVGAGVGMILLGLG
ncbi:MAG: glycosyltransferase family 2 protein, partial [Desulfofustis sp.]|nr:glycosyltransferase family 2 protein [Desulfofustis sp.]